ncbi:MAG: hypothetical protein M5U14_08675 [Acidimicrobiia bacterium]|nr:hypothetical protein [Acidimicrobiia bacterium]
MLAAVVVTVGATVAPAPPAGAFPGPAPPGPVPAGQPGADGPCSRTGFDRPSPVDAHQRVWVFEPAGTGAPATTGGRCDDAHRPVVLVAHGYATNVIPIVYDGLIRHLVSHGFVVVYPGYSLLFNPPSSTGPSTRASGWAWRPRAGSTSTTSGWSATPSGAAWSRG